MESDRQNYVHTPRTPEDAPQHDSPIEPIELIKREKLEDLDEDGKKNLQEISASCKTCQFMGPNPLRFRAVIPDEADKLFFGDELSIDIMCIEGNSVLHVVDTATRFLATKYLDTNGADYDQGFD
jgi:hypothetical protein